MKMMLDTTWHTDMYTLQVSYTLNILHFFLTISVSIWKTKQNKKPYIGQWTIKLRSRSNDTCETQILQSCNTSWPFPYSISDTDLLNLHLPRLLTHIMRSSCNEPYVMPGKVGVARKTHTKYYYHTPQKKWNIKKYKIT